MTNSGGIWSRPRSPVQGGRLAISPTYGGYGECCVSALQLNFEMATKWLFQNPRENQNTREIQFPTLYTM